MVLFTRRIVIIAIAGEKQSKNAIQTHGISRNIPIPNRGLNICIVKVGIAKNISAASISKKPVRIVSFTLFKCSNLVNKILYGMI